MKEDRNKQKVFDARGRWVISFYDWFILIMFFVLFTEQVTFSYWYLGFFAIWERPYIVLGDSVHNLRRNIYTRRLEKKMIAEEISKKEENEDIQNDSK